MRTIDELIDEIRDDLTELRLAMPRMPMPPRRYYRAVRREPEPPPPPRGFRNWQAWAAAGCPDDVFDDSA